MPDMLRKCLSFLITGIAVPNPHPEREAAIATHPQTEEHLLERIAPIFTMSIGWTRGNRVVCLLRLLPIGRHLAPSRVPAQSGVTADDR
jgi:hypothetical protein